MPSVLIPLAQGCEELEVITVSDLLRRAGITVITASLSETMLITASQGMRLMADTVLESVIYDDFDMIILSGGMPGSTNLDQDPHVHALLKRLDQQGKAIAAICAAPLILAHAGLLNGKKATCYPSVLSHQAWPEIKLSDDPVVIDDRIITSQGPGTAMDFALVLIEYLLDKDIRDSVEKSLVRSQ